MKQKTAVVKNCKGFTTVVPVLGNKKVNVCD